VENRGDTLTERNDTIMNYCFRTGLLAMLTVLGAAAQTNSDTATIQALLTEVRQLRQALERSAVLAPRMQLAMQRVQTQEQKVARISAQLDAVRRQIGDQSGSTARAAEELALFEQRVSAEMDATRRKQLEDHRAELKMMASRVVDPALKARESELANSLQAEQAALDDLNQKLNTMEQMLDVQPAATRQQ
jgi:chromosome segregation ATPase